MFIYISKLIDDLKLDVIVKGDDEKKVSISNINRPGLQLAGYFDYFASERIQVLGKAEMKYLQQLDSSVRYDRLKYYFSFDMPCLVFSRDIYPSEEIVELAKEQQIWIVRTKKLTTRIISKIMNYLDRELAEETMIHGVLCDIYGLGILIVGESGIGKSETALELIKRGHRLVTDDAVNIKNIDQHLLGRSPYITEGMIEVRGLGIIDVPALYGLSSIRKEKYIDFVIQLERWQEGKNYDRLGSSDDCMDILGVKKRKIVLPVMPGRNLAVIIETAAVNHRYNVMGEESPIDKIERRMMESR